MTKKMEFITIRSTNIKWTILKLAILEVILGVICMALGIVLLVAQLSNGSNNQFGFNTTLGEGIWCGVWVVIAGGYGILVEVKEEIKMWLVYAHIGFSVIGTMTSVFLFGISVLFSTFFNVDYIFEVHFSMTALSFLSFLTCTSSVWICCGFYSICDFCGVYKRIILQPD